jgi:membrane associated rhomboid family serine protease
MVVVQEAKSVAEARTVVELLEANQIVALVNLEVEGILFPWKEPPKKGAARVLVPSSMLPQAREVLRRAQPRGRSFPGVRSLRALAEKTSAKAPLPPKDLEESLKLSATPLFGGDVVPRAPPRFWGEKQPQTILPPDLERDDEEQGPLDLELPEPKSLTGRIFIAMIAIALGTAFQRVLEHMLGPNEVLARFAAKSPVTEEVWRLVTGGFLHTSPEHFFSNAVFAILLGVVLFGTHEVGATSLVWLVSSMLGLGMESSLSSSALLVAGASAGNYGLVGLWANGQVDRARHSLLPRRQLIQTVGLVLLLVPGALTPITATGTRVAVVAHAIGFLVGFLLGFIFKRRLLPEGFARITKLSRLAGVVVILVVLTALIEVALLLVA